MVLNKTGTADGTVSVTGSGMTNRTVIISNITGTGTLGISIAPNTASDAAGNMPLAAGPSATFVVDNAPPALTIGVPSASLTSTGPITYTVTYDGASTVTLANGNITLEKVGTANGTVTVSGTGFYLDDGNKLTDHTGYAGIKVWTGVSGVSREGTNVMVTGPVSCRKVGAVVYPQILARDIATP